MGTKTKDDKPSLENVMWLLERMNAREHPITTRQLLQFGKFPDGIVPRDCLEAHRLPDTYRPSFSTSQQAVWGLSVTPKGEPCIITKIDRMNVVVCGEKVYSLIPDGEKIEGVISLIGFTDTGLPVTRHNGDVFEPYDVGPYIIFKGNEKFLEDDGLYCPALMQNGDIISFSRNGKDGYKVCRNERVLIAHTAERYVQFFEDEDGTILSRWREGATLAVVAILGKDQRLALNHVQAIVATIHGTRFVGYDGRLYDYDRDQWCMFMVQPGYEYAYRGHYTLLPDGRAAYVGTSKRDHLNCWVVAGEAQPGFEFVSPLFTKEGKHLYFGVIGRHLYTMALPQPHP